MNRQDDYGAVVAWVEGLEQGCGPLAGLTFAAKDIFDVAGLPTQAGNPDFAERWGLPTQDAWAVAALKRAGARLVAKTHTHELAYGMTGLNPHFGTPQNPRAPGGIPGGSSSGSAVAVAAGLVPVALGSDTAGSVRIPASFCGVYAYRPTHGAIPTQGVVPLAPSYDTVGLLAADPALMERFARVLLSGALPVVGFERAVVVSDALELSTSEAQRAVERVAQRLRALGIATLEKRLGLLEEARETQRVLQGAEAWGFHQEWLEVRQPRLGEDVRRLLEMASRLTAGEVGRALSHQVRLRAEMGAWFSPGTLVLLPATPSSAPLVSELQDPEKALALRWRTLSLTCYASLLGAPVVSVPVVQPGAKPVGVQLVGPWGSDMGLLELALRAFGEGALPTDFEGRAPRPGRRQTD
ncbi:amidase family protein [Meiothermus sp.]|uniref:amidase family protein n=1 Tax=Meiothermus sp. TaxID=1955249 RepID=UPI0021DD7A0C|nr:amidase family protein [Meiothermus sp.]GIW24315.1 MAG: amidase [Meiothermus sp.]